MLGHDIWRDGLHWSDHLFFVPNKHCRIWDSQELRTNKLYILCCKLLSQSHVMLLCCVRGGSPYCTSMAPWHLQRRQQKEKIGQLILMSC
jgi:hypothetical protein